MSKPRETLSPGRDAGFEYDDQPPKEAEPPKARKPKADPEPKE